MKKVLIITITDYNNFGNRLQNYALQTFLTEKNFEVTTLENSFVDKNTIKTIKSLKKITLKHIIMSIYIRLKNKFLKIFNAKEQRVNEIKFKRKIELGKEFTKNYINEKKIELEELKKFSNNIDYIIVGSDQIWNPYFIKSFYIDFAQFSLERNKIAYGASIGISNIPNKIEKIYKDNLNEFKKISMREDRGCEILKKITGRLDLERVLDPTMLLKVEKWNNMCSRPNCYNNSKYILTYFLGQLSSERKREIKRVAKENNCEIINILDYRDPFYTSGPNEFLWLEKNAFLICTDSFHSAVFAILFNRPFVVFDREDKSEKMNSRIDTLIEKFNLKNRKYNGINITKENLEHDYAESYKILEEERKKSDMFLKKALEIEDENNE